MPVTGKICRTGHPGKIVSTVVTDYKETSGIGHYVGRGRAVTKHGIVCCNKINAGIVIE